MGTGLPLACWIRRGGRGGRLIPCSPQLCLGFPPLPWQPPQLLPGSWAQGSCGASFEERKGGSLWTRPERAQPSRNRFLELSQESTLCPMQGLVIRRDITPHQFGILTIFLFQGEISPLPFPSHDQATPILSGIGNSTGIGGRR